MKQHVEALPLVLLLVLVLATACQPREMRRQPSLERQSQRVAERHRWSVPFSGREPSYKRVRAETLTNPLPASEETIATGKALFEHNCDFCHGATGLGDGKVAPFLGTTPKDLTSSQMGSRSDGEFFLAISRGSGSMPSFRVELSLEQRWALVHYVRTLSAAPKGTSHAPSETAR